MYTGIKNREKYKPNIKLPTKIQIITEEETIVNDILRKNLVVKTVDYTADQNIKYTDFEVNNLLAAGIDINNQNVITMQPNREKVFENAEKADKTLEQIELINQFENENKQQTTTNQPKQEETT